MSVSDRKAALRKDLLDRRNAISQERWKSNSNRIIGNLYKLNEFQSLSVIHTFVSMNERKEVNTHDLIKSLLDEHIEVVVPITDFETGKLNHSLLKSFEDLKKNKWGVLEPTVSNTKKRKIDLILVPLLAADKNFNRLGYGKGFYDRFLASEQALKVGLLFDDFIIDEIPVEDFDEKLDILITEKRILRRNNI